jgi:hypothetical protein
MLSARPPTSPTEVEVKALPLYKEIFGLDLLLIRWSDFKSQSEKAREYVKLQIKMNLIDL